MPQLVGMLIRIRRCKLSFRAVKGKEAPVGGAVDKDSKMQAVVQSCLGERCASGMLIRIPSWKLSFRAVKEKCAAVGGDVSKDSKMEAVVQSCQGGCRFLRAS